MSDFKDFKPFYRKHESSGEEKSTVITLRVNEQERALINKARELLDVEADTRALKIVFKIGLRVLQSSFGEETLKYLFSRERERKSDFEKPRKAENKDFVLEKTNNL